ncbi:hypothetical protein P5V15_005940 [Pogonomyrmex californicus]
MDALSMEEKVYLIECFYTRSKNYTMAYRNFRNKFGSKKILNFIYFSIFFRRISNNFMYGTLNDHRHDLSGPSHTVTTEKTIDNVRTYFDENPNISIRNAAQTLDLKRETFRKIARDLIELHLVIELRYSKFAYGSLEWPLYSPDLNRCDFFLWGYLKDKCNAIQPQNIAELIKNIQKCTRSFLHPFYINHYFCIGIFDKKLRLHRGSM